MIPFPLKTRLFAAGAIALALAACNDDKAPAAQGAAPLPVLDASATLPYAPPATVKRYEPEEGYRWAERAYGVQRAVYQTPPDYRFAYGEDEPLAWETADDWSVYAEPWDDGHRYYYYEPGGDYPYFVRDDDYGYGYNRGGVLVVVVDARGRYLPVEDFRRVAPMAGRYYARGRDLRSAGLNARRSRIDDRAWAAQAPRVSRSAERWLTAARDDNDWRRWREADRGRELDRFTAEQLRRAEAQRDRAAQQARQDERRDFDARRGEQARDADFRAQAQRAEADRRQQAEREGLRARDDENRRQQAQAERRGRDQQAEQARARQAEATRGAEQRREAERAQQAQAERQRRDADDARQAQARAAERQAREAARAEQAQARAVQQQARAAEQAARLAAAHEKAAKPAKAAEPARADAPPKPRGKGEGGRDDRRNGRDKDKKD